MSKEELKALLRKNPNEFWKFVAQEGVTDMILSVAAEVEAELDGSGIDTHIATDLQEISSTNNR